MKRAFLMISFITASNITTAQIWSSLSNGFNNYAQTIFLDSIDNQIYFGGHFTHADSVGVFGIAAWDGNHWSALDTGQVYGMYNFAITKFQNEIYSDGRFVFGNTNNFGGKYNSVEWDSLGSGVSGPIYQMKEVNNELWVAGHFDMAGGQSCNMLAKWDGSSWICIEVPYFNAIHDFTFYNGNLVIAGNFYDSSSVNMDLAMFDGVDFSPIGHPIYGAVSYIEALTVYQGDLYIGGNFYAADGNEGNHIMRWNGSQWFAVGGGTDSRVDCFKEINGELFVGGGFQYAGSLLTGNLAKWNGVQWSSVTSSVISPEIYDMEVYDQELYIAGGFRYIDSLEVNYVAKCSGLFTNVESIEDRSITIYPNPVDDIVYVRSNLSADISFNLMIIDVYGHELIRYENLREAWAIDLVHFASGIYFMKVEYNNLVSTKILLKR